MSTEGRCWYLNQKGKAAGPFTFGDLKLMAAEGQLKGHDLVYKEGSHEWKRAYDWPEIVAECFADESQSSLNRLVKLPDDGRAIEDQWVLLVREEGENEVRFRQKGPFGTDEIRRMLSDEKIKASDHIWKKGAARWVPLFEIPEFKINSQKMTKEAEVALSQVESMPGPEEANKQSVREWALGLVKSAEERGELPAASKAQIFIPEVTGTNVEIAPPPVVRAPEDTPDPFPLISPAPLLTATEDEEDSWASASIRAIDAKTSSEIFEQIDIEQPTPVEAAAQDVAPVKAPPVEAALLKPKTKPMSAPVPAVAKVSAPLPSEPSPEDFEPPKTFLHKMTPVFAVLVVAVFGVGLWATINTDRSALQTPSGTLSYQVQPALIEPPSAPASAPNPALNPNPNPNSALVPAPSPVSVAQEPVAVSASPTPAAAFKQQTSAQAANAQAPSVDPNVEPPAETMKSGTLSASNPALSPSPDSSPNLSPNPSANPSPNLTSEYDGKNPLVRVNEAQTVLEIFGPFKKTDLLRIRLEGKAGQILDIPALVQKYEVRAAQDFYYGIALKDARIPKGEYLISVQYGVSRFSRGLSYGKDTQFPTSLTAHRKKISYEQQQEKKRLIKASKELAGMIGLAENQVQNQTAVRQILRDLERKAPKEMRLVRANRYELSFGDSWEKLAAQWARVQTTLKDNPNRNPASTAEFIRAKRATMTLESEVRNMSIWE